MNTAFPADCHSAGARTCHVKLLAKLLAQMALSISLLSACASLPSKQDRDAQAAPSPVLAVNGQLNQRQAAAVIESAAQATSSQQRSAVTQLTDAVRDETDSPFLVGNKVTPLIDGPETFASLRRSINDAKSSVHVETYIFADDKLGTDFAQLLIKKAQQGVEVRVIIDALGSMSTAAELFKTMRDGGVQVLEFQPLLSVHTLPWRYHNRDHRKLLIVDGRVAFTGGLNISGTYSSGSILKPGPERGVTEGWRDTHAQIEGPAVRQFQAIFFETWVRLGGQVDANNAKYFPPLTPVGMDIVAAVSSSGLRQRDESIYSTYLAAVSNAAQTVWITQAYFAPPPELRDALIAAVKRGVDVKVLVPGFTDSGPIFYASRAGYKKLLEGGVRLYEIKDALLHAKTAVFDQSLVIIGSANLDYRSFLHNNEVTAVVISGPLAQEMAKIFDKDEAGASEITLEQWQKRSLGERFKEGLSRLFNYWL
ncbi:MAG: phospholipase D-like domain-containing protein [Steroidobacteraceae bacterium]